MVDPALGVGRLFIFLPIGPLSSFPAFFFFLFLHFSSANPLLRVFTHFLEVLSGKMPDQAWCCKLPQPIYFHFLLYPS